MAEIYFRWLCAQRGLEEKITVDSSGVSAISGFPASELACSLLETEGLSLAAFRSKRLEPDLAAHAGLIVAMTALHKAYVDRVFPDCEPKTFTLLHFLGGDGDIADPYGGSMEVYIQCLEHMKPALHALLDFVEGQLKETRPKRKRSVANSKLRSN